MNELVIIGPFPPPLNGATKNTQLMSQRLQNAGWNVRKLNTLAINGRSHARSITQHLSRLGVFLKNLWSLGNGNLYYIVPDGGLALIYIVGYAFFLRNKKIIFHHRNYSHIYSPNGVMKTLLSLLPNATHVFLGRQMGEDFDQAYGVTTDKFVISNAALNDVNSNDQAQIGWSEKRKQTIGFLSNLTIQKGFDTVVEVYTTLASENPDLQFYLAGAPTGATEEALLQKLKTSLGDRLNYVGPVSGQAKQAFFSEIGIFLFPTKYKQEAQPNVIYEALASGCYVVSSQRACIPEMLSGLPATTVPEGNGFDQDMINATRRAISYWDSAVYTEIMDSYAREQDDARSELQTFLTWTHEAQPCHMR